MGFVSSFLNHTRTRLPFTQELARTDTEAYRAVVSWLPIHVIMCVLHVCYVIHIDTHTEQIALRP